MDYNNIKKFRENLKDLSQLPSSKLQCPDEYTKLRGWRIFLETCLEGIVKRRRLGLVGTDIPDVVDYDHAKLEPLKLQISTNGEQYTIMINCTEESCPDIYGVIHRMYKTNRNLLRLQPVYKIGNQERDTLEIIRKSILESDALGIT